MDIILILLGLLVILIFMAIFAQLRAMRSPYIKRFELVVNGRMKPLSGYTDSYHIPFLFNGRSFELQQIKKEHGRGKKTVSSDVVHLIIHSKTNFYLRCQSMLSSSKVHSYLDQVFAKPPDASLDTVKRKDIDNLLSAFMYMTDRPATVNALLDSAEFIEALRGFVTNPREFGPVIPLVFEHGQIRFYYSLSEPLLNQIHHNPRNLKKQLAVFDQFASMAEQREESL